MAIGRDNVSDPNRYSKGTNATKSDMSMMRIAVAGTGGLALLIAHYITEDTSHHVVLLSRQPQPALGQQYQVAVVDYRNLNNLTFALRGIDTVISTVTGANQVELIKAAVQARVRRFAPAEFEGPPQLRPTGDPLDRGRTAARQWLLHYQQHIQTTVFVCGILYERFQPGGLRHSAMGVTSGFSNEGDYIMNCRAMTAEVPAYNARNEPTVTICMTAAEDVARFVTKALDLPHWPAELRMSGQRVQVTDLVALVQQLKGQTFNPIQWHNIGSLQGEHSLASLNADTSRLTRINTLISTAAGRYDFTSPNMNAAFPAIRPMPFRDWFMARWNLQ